MKRRDLLKAAVTLPLLPLLMRSGAALAHGVGTLAVTLRSRLRPGEPGWPAAAEWERLKRQVSGQLLKLESPFAPCSTSQPDSACAQVLKQLDNPFAVGDNPAPGPWRQKAPPTWPRPSTSRANITCGWW